MAILLVRPSSPRPVGRCCKIRALFPIHFDVDEVGVHEGCGGVVLETLMRHDVAPVAGGISDGQQNGFVLVAGFGQGLRSPGLPMDRVISVLQKIRAGFFGKTIFGHLWLSEFRLALWMGGRCQGSVNGARLIWLFVRPRIGT